MDYAYLCQLNSYVVGGGLNSALWVCYRKETSHLLELFCSKQITKIETRVLTLSGGWLQYSPETPVTDEEWERAETTHPFDPTIHQEVMERFHQVIQATPTTLPEREYGPRLVCPKCNGEGFYLTEKLQTKKECTACKGTGKVLEPKLDYPCTYCRFKHYCWPRLFEEVREIVRHLHNQGRCPTVVQVTALLPPTTLRELKTLTAAVKAARETIEKQPSRGDADSHCVH
jgi:hypothetical protein